MKGRWRLGLIVNYPSLAYSSHDEFLQHHPILEELVFAADFDAGVGIYCDRPE
jgi:hypothetical protein